MSVTAGELLEALTELVNERQPLGIECCAYQRALDVLQRIDDATARDLHQLSITARDIWRVVPSVPTRAMLAAWWERADCMPNRWNLADSYRAMVEAAPTFVGWDLADGPDQTVVREVKL